MRDLGYYNLTKNDIKVIKEFENDITKCVLYLKSGTFFKMKDGIVGNYLNKFGRICSMTSEEINILKELEV